MSHAAKVARILGGERVLVVSSPRASEVRVDLSAEGHEPASVWLAVRNGAPEAEDVRRAMDALLEGRSVDFAGSHPIARASWAAEPPQASAAGSSTEVLAEAGKRAERGPRKRGAPRPRNQRVGGWSLSGIGIASIGASVGLHLWRGNLGDQLTEAPSSLSAAQRWNDARIGVWTTAAFGGAAVSAAMPLLLPDYARTPWWGWTLGVAGLGLTGYAIYEGVTMTDCPEPYIADEAAVRSCVARGQEAGRLALALAGAAPLLSIPLVYLFRPLRAHPSVAVASEGAVVRVRKAF
jgi:hypothetical protein